MTHQEHVHSTQGHSQGDGSLGVVDNSSVTQHFHYYDPSQKTSLPEHTIPFVMQLPWPFWLKVMVFFLIVLSSFIVLLPYIEGKFDGNRLISMTSVLVFDALVSLFLVSQLWEDIHRKHTENLAGCKVSKPKYFRLSPYDAEKECVRHDDMQNVVLKWVKDTKAPLLYLSGMSGSGKSSIVSGWVIPKLKEGSMPYTIVETRIVDDPVNAIKKALLTPDVIWARPAQEHSLDMIELLKKSAKKTAPHTLLIVLDQFEEFFILATEEKHQEFKQVIDALVRNPIDGVQILAILRTDYQGFIDKLGLPRLFQGDNWQEVSPFIERDAMQFLRDSQLNISKALEKEILQEAREIEETTGLIRPITMNLFGLVLNQFERLPKSYRAGRYLQHYLSDLIKHKPVSECGAKIVRAMITSKGTKFPVSVDEIAKKTGLGIIEVRGCLVHLGNQNIVRELDPMHGVWEISHDFIAKLYDRILAGWKISFLKQWRYVLLGAGLLLWLGFIGLAPVLYQEWAATRLLQGLEISVTGEKYKKATFSRESNNETLKKAVEALRVFDVKALDLSSTQVADISVLQRLTALQTLDLSDSKVSDITALQHLTGLQTLNLSNSKVSDITALQHLTGLQTLDLFDSKVSDITALQHLTGLQTLSLSGSKVSDITALQHLTGLQTLDLSDSKVIDITALQHLTGLRTLDLSDSNVSDITALQHLTGLQKLYLSDSKVRDITALQHLTALRTLNLLGTQVKNIDSLQHLKYLEVFWFAGKAPSTPDVEP